MIWLVWLAYLCVGVVVARALGQSAPEEESDLTVGMVMVCGVVGWPVVLVYFGTVVLLRRFGRAMRPSSE